MNFFAICVIAGNQHWLELKKIVVAARTNKNERTLEILRESYMNTDIICISEASVTFLDNARASMGEHFMIPTPKMTDSQRDQNSFLMLSKEFFGNGKFADPVDITPKAQACFSAEGAKQS